MARSRNQGRQCPKKTLLYPFSGPDFFNAYAFFPDHSRYVFFSLERPGALPDIESVTTLQFVKLLTDVRGAFRDIFERNYFITSYMNKQLTTPWVRGTVPVMATMMALMNRRIVRIEPLDLFPDLTKAYDTPEGNRPRMTFAACASSSPTCCRCHAAALLFLNRCDRQGARVLSGFSQLGWTAQTVDGVAQVGILLVARRTICQNSGDGAGIRDILVQDDTGIPYRYLNQTPWHVKLYGKYHKPVRPMGYAYRRTSTWPLRTRR